MKVEKDVRAAINLEMIEQAAIQERLQRGGNPFDFEEKASGNGINSNQQQASSLQPLHPSQGKNNDMNPYDSDTSNFWDLEEMEDDDDVTT